MRNQSLMPLIIKSLVLLGSVSLCRNVEGQKGALGPDEEGSLITKSVESAPTSPTVMTDPHWNVSLITPPSKHSSIFNKVSWLLAFNHNMHNPGGVLKMLNSAELGYQVLDEFGKATSIPFEGGLLNITNCPNAEYTTAGQTKRLTQRILSIPGHTFNLTTKQFKILMSCDGGSLNPPSGFVLRVATNPERCSENLNCGEPKVPFPPYLCMDDIQNTFIKPQPECSQFKPAQSIYGNYMGMAHNQPAGSQCVEPLNITYSIKNSTNTPLIPGSLILVMHEDEGVILYTKQDYSLSCKMITKRNRTAHEVNVVAQGAINPKAQLETDGIVRVDCDIAKANESVTATTYFFIADGELRVQKQCKGGKPSCSLPAWVNDYSNPIINYGTEEVLTCIAQITICFPKKSNHAMTSSKNCVAATESSKPTEGSDDSEQNWTAMIIIIVLAILVVCGVLLSILYKDKMKACGFMDRLRSSLPLSIAQYLPAESVEESIDASVLSTTKVGDCEMIERRKGRVDHPDFPEDEEVAKDTRPAIIRPNSYDSYVAKVMPTPEVTFAKEFIVEVITQRDENRSPYKDEGTDLDLGSQPADLSSTTASISK